MKVEREWMIRLCEGEEQLKVTVTGDAETIARVMDGFGAVIVAERQLPREGKPPAGCGGCGA